MRVRTHGVVHKPALLYHSVHCCICGRLAFLVVRRLYAGVADWVPVQIELIKLSLILARCKEVNLY